jgi:hypothetical protein
MTAVGMLLAACSHGVRPTEADRAALKRAPVIHVLHYETAPPTVKAYGKQPLPAAAELRRTSGADPAALVAASLGRLFGKKEKLNNLRMESQHLPRPVAASALDHKPKFRRGLALELWLDTWSFESVAGNPSEVGMRLEGRARLSRLDDGQVLWSTGRCRVGGSTNRDYRLAASDLRNTVKLRKLLNEARNECARQLVRDFDIAPDRKG